MARKQLTPSQQKAKVAKMKATKAANKAKAMEAIGYVAPKKMRKKRKPMDPTQKAAAIARLAKAREARGATGDSAVHKDVKALGDDHPLNTANVKGWYKKNKAELASIKGFKDSKESKERSHYRSLEVYVSNLATYLRTGVWLDNRWGEDGEHTMGIKVTTKAYYPDGTIKRTKGFWYDDIGIAE
jgi:hypothetical protein